MSAPMPPCRCCVACTVRWPRSDACHLATGTASVASRPVVEEPGGVPQRDPHGLDVDGRIGRPQHGALKAAQRPPELGALVEVGRGLAQGRLADPDLECAEPGGGGLQERLERGPARGRVGQHLVGGMATSSRWRWGWISRLVVTVRSSDTPGLAGSTSRRTISPSACGPAPRCAAPGAPGARPARCR